MRKPLRWLGDVITTPPFSQAAASEAAGLLEVVALGGVLAMPYCRPMRSVGPRCFELRVNDRDHKWRIIYHVAADAIVILDVFSKQSRVTPRRIIERCRRRLKRYERDY